MRKDPKGRAFAFVAYETPEAARQAVQEMHMKPNGKEDSTEGPDGHPEDMIYCQRAQSKAERQAELRAKFASMDASKGGVNLYVKRLVDSFRGGLVAVAPERPAISGAK